MAFDLGLHLDMTLHVAGGTLSQAEATLRAEVFWGIYMIDQLSALHHDVSPEPGLLTCKWWFSCWGFYLGRPFRTHAENITVPKPRADPDHPNSTRQWVPYISAEHLQERPNSTYDVSELHLQKLRLVEVMTPVANAV